MKESTLRSALEEMGFSRSVVADVLETITPPPAPGCKRTVVDPNLLIERLMEETRRKFGDLAVAELTENTPGSTECMAHSLSDESSTTSTTTSTSSSTSVTSSTDPPYVNPFLTDEELAEQAAVSQCRRDSYQNPFDLNEENKCKICMDKNIDTVILRCGHLAVCMICSKGLKKCPICRKHIAEVVRTFRA